MKKPAKTAVQHTLVHQVVLYNGDATMTPYLLYEGKHLPLYPGETPPL